MFLQRGTIKKRAAPAGNPAFTVRHLIKPADESAAAVYAFDQPIALRAFLNSLSHAPASCQSSGCQELDTALWQRSGCGIIMVTRPSAEVIPVMPFGDPFGLNGYLTVGST